MAMFENISEFFKRFMQTDKKELLAENPTSQSKDTAKDRLHVVLMQDRANVSADFLELMKEEIIEVIKKYIVVDEEKIDVRLTNEENEDGSLGAPLLHANIPILNVRNDQKGAFMNPVPADKIEGQQEINVEENNALDEQKEEAQVTEQVVEEPTKEQENETVEETTEESEAQNEEHIEEVEPQAAEDSVEEAEPEASEEAEKQEAQTESEESKEIFEDLENNGESVEGESQTSEEVEDDEEDDDVTFDDLLKAAEEEEEKIKQEENKKEIKTAKSKHASKKKKTSKNKK